MVQSSVWSMSQSAFVWIPVLLFTSCVTLGKLLKLSVFHFPHLSKRANNSIITEENGVY